LERKSKSDFYEDIEIFPTGNAIERLEEVKEWLKSKGVHEFDKVGLEKNSLPTGIVKKIETSVDKIIASEGPPKFTLKDVLSVPRKVSIVIKFQFF